MAILAYVTPSFPAAYALFFPCSLTNATYHWSGNGISKCMSLDFDNEFCFLCKISIEIFEEEFIFIFIRISARRSNYRVIVFKACYEQRNYKEISFDGDKIFWYSSVFGL